MKLLKLPHHVAGFGKTQVLFAVDELYGRKPVLEIVYRMVCGGIIYYNDFRFSFSCSPFNAIEALFKKVLYIIAYNYYRKRQYSAVMSRQYTEGDLENWRFGDVKTVDKFTSLPVH